jgi:hypothetical protein
MTALRARWFETDEQLWLWLDRAHHRLFGSDLSDHLAWCEAGDLLRVEWAPDVVVLRVAGHDDAIQHEESRLMDVDALASLRGGLGESYRRSLQAILDDAADGLTFADLVAALSSRQGHPVHRGTVRALLSAGGFVKRDGRWFAAEKPKEAARRLRGVLVSTLADLDEPVLGTESASRSERLRSVARGIRGRLSEIIDALRT